MMVYVTVGNHVQPFDRLLRVMDGYAQQTGADVVMQTGASRASYPHTRTKDFYPFNEAEGLIRAADAVVGHAGIGTIISAQTQGVPLVICPRRAESGEHYNNHQLEICEELAANPRPGVRVAMRPEDIPPRLDELIKKGKQELHNRPRPGAGIKQALQEFIEQL